MAFVTAADLAAYTNGLVDPSDPRLEPLIEGATAGIQSYCGWNIAPPEDVELTLDGGSNVLYLPTLKLNSVESLRVRGSEVQPVDYEWSRRTGNLRLRGGRSFPDAWGGVEVKFNSGYADVPADVAQVVLQVCSVALSSPTGATREQAGQIAMSWATTAPGVAGGMSLLNRDLAVLNKYRIALEA